MYPERNRRSRVVPAQNHKKKHDPITKCTLARCWAAAVVLLLCVWVSRTNPTLSAQLQQTYTRLLNAPLGQSRQVWQQTAAEVGLNVLLGRMEESILVFAGQPARETDPAVGGENEWNGADLPAEATTLRPVLSAPAVHPVNGLLSCNFGPRVHPITGKNDFHTGIDIAAAGGSGIYAAWPGQVSQTGNSAVYGNYLIIDHGQGIETVYCHCAKVLAQQGAHIRAGERVAQVGSTGISTGNHLHFELRLNGQSADPLCAFDL